MKNKREKINASYCMIKLNTEFSEKINSSKVYRAMCMYLLIFV